MENIGVHDWVGILVAVLAGLVVLTLSLVAIMQIGRAAHLSPTKRTNWVLAVLLAPVFGATAWFAVGNRLRLD
ncbi:PLDc N-terminal domain-containing protein [Cryobacterium sp. Y50]|nr:PLDc N-terminal domain-containing protein [Cryobacterium sp. Y50]